MTCSRRKDTGDRHVETKIPQCRWTNSKQREHQLPEVQYQWAQTRQLVWTRTSTRRTQTMSVKTVPQLLSAGRQHTHSPVVHNRNTWKDNGASSRRLHCQRNKIKLSSFRICPVWKKDKGVVDLFTGADSNVTTRAAILFYTTWRTSNIF